MRKRGEYPGLIRRIRGVRTGSGLDNLTVLKTRTTPKEEVSHRGGKAIKSSPSFRAFKKTKVERERKTSIRHVLIAEEG